MRNTGLIIDHKIRDWVFLGSDSKVDNIIAIETGDWTKYKPSNEKQYNKWFDTWNCVAFSACNVIEMYFKYLIDNHKISNRNLLWLQENGYIVDGEVNVSDRFVGTKAGTKVGVGNTGSNVANAIHTHGLVPESAHPFLPSMKEEDYYTDTPSRLDALGQEFLARFKLPFEVVTIKNVVEALKYAPLQVYVNAWYKNNNGEYYNPSKKVNHAVTRIKSDRKQIFDHYDPFIKTLVSDYYYFPYGYKFTVVEKISVMNVEEFVKQNDLLFVRNEKTGQFGRIMQGKLKFVETEDRGTLLLLDDAVRTNGKSLSSSEWDALPKEEF